MKQKGKQTKIGIYSGTFDPVHDGHIAFALEAASQCGLDKVFLMTEPRPRRKQGVKAFEHRAAMLELAVQDYDKLGSIVLNQARFTPRETMPVLLQRFQGASLYMLIGDDMLDHFAEWPHVSELVSAVKFIIGVRKYDKSFIESIINTMKQTNGLRLEYELFEPTKFDVSSSTIRRNIKKDNNYDYLDPRVSEYIQANGLYSVGEK